MTIIRTFKARFAIRSGGHQPCPGYGSAGGDAVVIDMNRVCNVKISDDRSSIAFGPGKTWKHIYEYLADYDVSVIGGRTGDVGIGGLILGGGLPSFSSEYGLVCDNVLEYEIVLADSSVVRANKTDHKDLYWALKGGGANFGASIPSPRCCLRLTLCRHCHRVRPPDSTD